MHKSPSDVKITETKQITHGSTFGLYCVQISQYMSAATILQQMSRALIVLICQSIRAEVIYINALFSLTFLYFYIMLDFSSQMSRPDDQTTHYSEVNRVRESARSIKPMYAGEAQISSYWRQGVRKDSHDVCHLFASSSSKSFEKILCCHELTRIYRLRCIIASSRLKKKKKNICSAVCASWCIAKSADNLVSILSYIATWPAKLHKPRVKAFSQHLRHRIRSYTWRPLLVCCNSSTCSCLLSLLLVRGHGDLPTLTRRTRDFRRAALICIRNEGAARLNLGRSGTAALIDQPPAIANIHSFMHMFLSRTHKFQQSDHKGIALESLLGFCPAFYITAADVRIYMMMYDDM